MKKIMICFAVLACALTVNTQGQTRQYYNFGWDVSMPMGSFSDFISNTSLRGAYFSGNVFVADAFSIGFKFGYNGYYENVPRQTYQLGDGVAVTAASYNFCYQVPSVVGGYYHFNAGGSFEPYIGLGLGVNFLSQEALVQDYEVYDTQWAFILNPEAGLRYNFANVPLGITLRVGYNHSFNTFTFHGTEYKNTQTLNFGLSLGWTIN